MPAETHVEQGPMSRQEVFELIRDRLADILEIEPSSINEGDSFTDDLEADSLALIELVEALEEEVGERTVGFRIEDEDLEDLKTVRDAVDYVFGRARHLSRWTPIRSSALAGRLGHEFADPELLADAVRHRTWCAEHPGSAPNERLEFLGDAVLGLVVADHIFTLYPDQDEGWLSRARASSCAPARSPRWPTSSSSATRSASARARTRPAAGRRPRSSPTRGGRDRRRLPRRRLGAGPDLVLGLVRDRLDALVEAPGVPDYKTRLQELASRDLHTEIRYDVAEVGPEHDKTFTASRSVGGRLLGRGSGRSKKQAEQVAANEALLSLAAEPDGLRARGSKTPVRGPGCLSCPKSRRSAASSIARWSASG